MTSPAEQDLHDDHEVDDDPTDTALLLTLTALLAAGVPRAQLTDRVIALLGPLGITPVAARAAVTLAAGPAHGVPRPVALHGATRRPGVYRSATSRAVSGEPMMRARYLLASARRLAGSLTDGRAGFTRALAAERTYRAQHDAAQTRRLNAASGVDVASGQYGEVLGWYTVVDGRTTPDCMALDGTNFRADSEPAGGWPGARHGGTCRCSAGEPHAAAGAGELLDEQAA